MFCNNCGTQYDVTPAQEGKSKFCRKCGSFLYANKNNQIVFTNSKEFEAETERKQQEIEKERLEQEKARAIEQQQLEKELLQKEKEKLEQEYKTLQAKLAREQEEKDRLEKEKQELERERTVQQNKEREILEKIRLEKEQKENALQEQVRLAMEKIKKEEQELTESSEQKKGVGILKYILSAVAVILLGGLVFYYFYPEKALALFHTKSTTSLTSGQTVNVNPAINSDSVLIKQISSDLSGKEILSWGILKQDDLSDITINSKDESADRNSYLLTVQLDDKDGTRAIAELALFYNKIILDSVSTKCITYKNTAPANAWFSFQPVPNCAIKVNTNSNSILCKSCNNCQPLTINSSVENPTRIKNTQTIFISSNTGTSVIVEFTYTPEI